MPTIAFGGATEVPQEAWSLVEGLAPAYGSDWWYAGMLAFIRQEQKQWDEELPVPAILEVVDTELMTRPRTAFAALHVAVARAAARDLPGLAALRAHAAGTPDPVLVTTVAPTVRGLELPLAGRAGAAADALRDVVPGDLAGGR
ncbi:MAG: hypothetical protein M3O55_00420 [Actinomycetota bacterium]|nr:hypothetical protein [Actinomycetota bacterium]